MDSCSRYDFVADKLTFAFMTVVKILPYTIEDFIKYLLYIYFMHNHIIRQYIRPQLKLITSCTSSTIVSFFLVEFLPLVLL